MIFHYKPSNYWGTPIYGKPQVMIARLKKETMPLRRLRYESWVHKRWG